MKKGKKHIYIWVICILTLLIVITLCLIIALKKQADFSDTQKEVEIPAEIEQAEKVNDKKEYLSVKQCLNKYVSAINKNSSSYYGYDKNNNYTIIAKEETINTNIYSVLSTEYIRKNAITIANVQNFVYEIKANCFYIPLDIYKKGEYGNVKVYGIYGVIEDDNYNPIAQSYLILNIDEVNNTFSVEQLNSKEELDNVQIKEITAIENKINNMYQQTGLINDNLIIDYVTTYKRLALAYPEIVYNRYLDEEYKIKKFGSIEEYKKYVNNNKDSIKSINIEKYYSEEQREYTQYIAVDKNNKHYIFNVANTNDYKILLDTYTIDIPQFIENYNNANNNGKVGYNVQKIIDAINDGDYSYVYSKLDSTFKQNNFNSVEIFKQYIKNNLYNKNAVEQELDSSNQGEIYIYNINIKNLENENEHKKMTIIMKLGEGTDFTMSFSM